MKDRTLLYYLEANQDTLLPPSTMTAPINSKEWYVKLKDHFNDLIWLYYSDRTVFINDRFKLDDTDERTILNIMRSFAINLKTKNYEYENLYNSTVLEFNPLWNVDGVEGVIHEYTTNTTGGDSHSGKDSHSSNHSKDITRNRGMSDELKNDDTLVETSRATYDSGDTYYPIEKTHTIHGTLNNPKHQITENVTDKDKGNLREEANKEGYKSLVIPSNIGGRYSFITPTHLLPLSINYDIDEIIDGYYHGKRLIDKAYQYAVTRKLLFDLNRNIENFCISEQSMGSFTEWLKQLFGETEGKERVGIFPTSSIHTRDLHSLGQFIQDGNKILFETYIRIDKVDNYIEYNGRSLHEISNIVSSSVIRAHYKGDVPCIEITLDELTPYNLSCLIYFFQLSAAFSAYLFGVEPFNQPGVEIYKKEIQEALKG